MKHYFYDLHTHSALSPCGDNFMTPNNLAGFCALAGLQIVALTDHNTCGNCSSFMAACRRYGLCPVPGMELTTAEEIHLVCLFPSLSAALEFEELVRPRRMKLKNKKEIFGEQYLFDEEDRVVGEEPFFLLAATEIFLWETPKLVSSCDGVCYPAHIDRPSGGLPFILGDFPPDFPFEVYELHDCTQKTEFEKRYPLLKEKYAVCSSDAHHPEQIRDASHRISLDGQDEGTLRQSLFCFLRNPVETGEEKQR